MDFEEWWDKNGELYRRPTPDERYLFESGQQSKQAEIDALKAKLDNLTKWAEFHIEDYNLSESESEHDRGWFNAACQVFKTLKENNNDT